MFVRPRAVDGAAEHGRRGTGRGVRGRRGDVENVSGSRGRDKVVDVEGDDAVVRAAVDELLGRA